MATSTLKLTAQGRAKIENAVNLAKVIARSSLRQSTEQILKPKILQRTPSHEEEAIIISRGTPPGGGLIGTPKGGRFLKHEVGFKYLREAIQDEKVVIEPQEDKIMAKLGHIRSLNAQIGFGWKKKVGKKSYTRRTTRTGDSRWTKLLQMWEFGGTGTFTVVPRDSKDWGKYDRPALLLPEDRRPVASMQKSIKPRNMYRLGLRDSRKAMIAFIGNDIKGKIRKRFGK